MDAQADEYIRMSVVKKTNLMSFEMPMQITYSRNKKKKSSQVQWHDDTLLTFDRFFVGFNLHCSPVATWSSIVGSFYDNQNDGPWNACPVPCEDGTKQDLKMARST